MRIEELALTVDELVAGGEQVASEACRSDRPRSARTSSRGGGPVLAQQALCAATSFSVVSARLCQMCHRSASAEWLRSDVPTSAERLFCHVHGRAKNQSQLIPGWRYSFVAALESGRTSWIAVLDAVRLGPNDDAAAVTADQFRAVVDRLTVAGHWHDGDPDILIVMDAGYDVTRLAFVLADLPVEVLGWIRSDRVLRLPTPPRHHPDSPASAAIHRNTVPSSPSTSPRPGPHRRTPQSPTPPATAEPPRPAGIGCTPG